MIGRSWSIMGAVKTAVFLSLSAACCQQAAGALSAGLKTNEELFTEGRYREAMIGFMDEVVKNPKNRKAREYLHRTGALLLREEVDTASGEREKLLLEAWGLRGKMVSLERDRRTRLAAWERLAERTRHLASDLDKLKEATASYKELLSKTPVYSDSAGNFSASLNAVKEAFYRTIKNEYPDLVSGKTTVDGNDIAAAAFADFSSGYFPDPGQKTRQTQTILDEAARIRELETRLSSLFKYSSAAFRHYRSGRYARAVASWKEILKFDKGNEEALLYLDLAAGHMKKEPLPPATDHGLAAPAVTKATAAAGPQARKKGKIQASKKVPETPVPDVLSSAAAAKEARLLYEAGVREFSQENYDEAIKYWQGCLKLDPGHDKARRALERARVEKAGR